VVVVEVTVVVELVVVSGADESGGAASLSASGAALASTKIAQMPAAKPTALAHRSTRLAIETSTPPG